MEIISEDEIWILSGGKCGPFPVKMEVCVQEGLWLPSEQGRELPFQGFMGDISKEPNLVQTSGHL